MKRSLPLIAALMIASGVTQVAIGMAAPGTSRSHFATRETGSRQVVVFNGSKKWAKKPRQIWLGDMANGGMLHLKWTSWTARRATGVGTSHPDHGVFHVRVLAFHPKDLTHILGFWAFFRLSVRFRYNGQTWTEKLGLARDSLGNDCWARLADIGNPSLGYTPWSP
jgi:hypothetical protein